jgi:hypothetical protein
MDAELPRVAEGFDLFDLDAGVFVLAVLHVALAGADLPVAAELDAVGRVEVDHLHLAAQALTLGQRPHHLQAVAQDHAVAPVGLVLVELDHVELVETVEGVEQGQFGFDLTALSGVAQVLDQHPRVDLLLDVDRRRIGY